MNLLLYEKFTKYTILRSALLGVGSGVVILITFGSLMTLSRVFGVLLLLSYMYELFAYLIHRKAVK